MASHNRVMTFYQTVIDDVVANVRESFLDEGMDDQLLHDFKKLWESKLTQSKALEEVSPDMGAFAKHHVMMQQQQQQKKHAAAAAAASHSALSHSAASHKTSTTYAPVTMSQTLQQQTPIIYNPVTGHMEMSTAATSGQMAAIRGFIPQGSSAPMQILLQPGNIAMTPTFVPRTNQPGMGNKKSSGQFDGANDSSSDDDDDDDENEKENDDEANEDENDEGREDAEPLNSEDDASEDDPDDLFDTDNVVVCQFDKINRTRNKWRFILKDGIMNLKGKDFLFQRATGDAEW